jgi:enoyl-CoA hydratase
VREGLGHLVFNQPPSNPMNNLFFSELGDLARNIIPASGVDGILLYGRGRHFSSGADLHDLLPNLVGNIQDEGAFDQEDIPHFLLENLETFRLIRQLKCPVISVISGVCLGAAFELALNCHIRICAENALLALPESSFNLLPGLAGIQHLLELTTPHKTFELVLGGNSFTALEASAWNLVDRVFSRNKALPYAERLAKFIGKNYNPIHKDQYLTEFDNSFVSSGS